MGTYAAGKREANQTTGDSAQDNLREKGKRPARKKRKGKRERGKEDKKEIVQLSGGLDASILQDSKGKKDGRQATKKKMEKGGGETKRGGGPCGPKKKGRRHPGTLRGTKSTGFYITKLN